MNGRIDEQVVTRHSYLVVIEQIKSEKDYAIFKNKGIYYVCRFLSIEEFETWYKFETADILAMDYNKINYLILYRVTEYEKAEMLFKYLTGDMSALRIIKRSGCSN